MREFKVGDKVRIVGTQSVKFYEIGDVAEIINVDYNITDLPYELEDDWVNGDDLELVEEVEEVEKEFNVGDIVKVVRDVNDGMEKEDSAKDVGRYFEIEEINNDFHFPYILNKTKWRRKREELQFIFRSEGKGEYHKTLIDDLNQVIIQKDNEIDHLNAFYPSHIETLEARIQELKDQLDYADEQLDNQSKIIEGLEDLAHELHDKLIARIKGE